MKAGKMVTNNYKIAAKSFKYRDFVRGDIKEVFSMKNGYYLLIPLSSRQIQPFVFKQTADFIL